MDDKQRNTLAMLETVQTYLQGNAAVWNGVPAAVSAVNDLSTAITAIDGEIEQQESPTGGITADKAQVRDDLEDQIMVVADPVAAYAAVEGNETLGAQVAVTRSGLDTTAEQRLDDIAGRVHTVATANLAALGDYGLAQADLDRLAELRDTFDSVKSTPRTAVATRAGRTASLPQMLRDARGIVRDRIDKLMTRYRNGNPQFYAGYQSARTIVDLRAKGPSAPPPIL